MGAPPLEHSSPRLPSRYVNRAEARRRFGALADRYASFMMRGDPLADELVRWMRGAAENALFEQALTQGLASLDDPPEPLRRFFTHVEARPDWLDDDALALGARTYQRMGKAVMFILSAWSLMNGYHSAPAVKPLAFTAQLAKMAPRRLAETGRFVVETCQDGGMKRFGQGFILAVRVRVLHARVRAMILRSGRWKTADWGVPINQADMLGTVMEFSLLVLAGARHIGYRFEPHESEALVHLWRYSGYLSGVDEELLDELSTEARGEHFAEMIKLIQPGPDQDSLDLAAALRVVPQQVGETEYEKRMGSVLVKVHDGLTWAFNGEAIASGLRIPNARWRHVVHPIRAMVIAFETTRRALGADDFVAAWGNRILRRDIARMLAGVEPSFQPKRV